MAEPKSKLKSKENGLFLKGKMDLSFFVLLMLILTTGLIMLFSASYEYAYTYFGDSYYFIKKQLLFAVGGVCSMLFVSKLNYYKYRKLAWPLYFISVMLLGLLLILPPMIPGVNYKRWIVVGPINFQPSEIAKFAIVLLFASLISSNYSRMKELKYGVFFLGFLLLAVCGLVVAETHLSATVLILTIGIIMLIAGGIKKKHLMLGASLGGLLAIGAGAYIVSYASSRVEHWLNPWADPSGDGYQTIQSLLAIGSGGFLGRGIGQSRQKYLWVPEPHNDFIFSIVCEELGFIGAMIIILMFCLLVWRGFVIAMRAPDKFSALLALGLTFQVGIQMVLNILVVTNTIPNTGISLPFFSYGGTSLLILLTEMGVILAISRTCSLQKT